MSVWKDQKAVVEAGPKELRSQGRGGYRDVD